MSPFLLLVITSIIALCGYLGNRAINEHFKRIKESKLGVELLTILIEEVETGYHTIMVPCKIYVGCIPESLPHKSWTGINTISDEILLRIFKVSGDIPNKLYQPQRIRMNTKDYFENVINAWDEKVLKLWTLPLTDENIELIECFMVNLGMTAKNVLIVLKDTRTLLEENTKKTFPK